MIKSVFLVVSEFPPGPGGIGNHAWSLALHLAKRGVKVHVLTDSNYAKMDEIKTFDKQLPELMKVSRIKRFWILTPVIRIWMFLYYILSNENEGIIFSGRFSLWLCGLMKLFFRKTSSLCVLHGSEIRLKNQLFNILTWHGISKADFLVPVSSFTHSLLPDKLKKKPFKIIENGIDIHEFSDLKGQLTNEEPDLKGDPALLTVGNVTYRKGQHRVIKALPEILKHFSGTQYHVAGLPSLKSEFQELAESIGVSSNVIFHGRLPHRRDIANAYDKADCFLILSENQQDGDVEGFGIVILEANYFGLPVIGASGCGIDDAIKHGFNGFLVDGNNAGQIANSLKEILERKEEFSKNAKQWAMAHDWNRIVSKYLEIFDQLIL